MLIRRDFTRSEEDDFKLNVQSRLTEETEAEEVRREENHSLVGWRIINKFE